MHSENKDSSIDKYNICNLGLEKLFLLIEKKKLRNTTSEKSKLREERDKEREARAQMLKDMAAQKRVSEVRRLTQEELLEEAKITEEENVKSLGRYT